MLEGQEDTEYDVALSKRTKATENNMNLRSRRKKK